METAPELFLLTEMVCVGVLLFVVGVLVFKSSEWSATQHYSEDCVCSCEFDNKVEVRYIFFVVILNQQSEATSVMGWQGGELHLLQLNVAVM